MNVHQIIQFIFFGLATGILMLTPSAADAQDEDANNHWHQWRGPTANGVASEEAAPPVQWSEEKNIAWKVEIEGEGSSTPIVWKDRVYLITAVETDQVPKVAVEPHPQTMTRPPNRIFDFKAICLDRKSGKQVWSKTLVSAAPHEGRHGSTSYASASPTTDGEHLFVSFGSYGVFCLTLDGETVWSEDLGDMRTRRGWGEAVSPVLAGDKLIVMWDQEDQSSIYALNQNDGSIAWEVKRDEPTTWATPLIVKRESETQIVTAGTNHVRSYELESGKLLWESEPLTLNAIPSPVLDGNNVVLMSGYRGNVAISLALQPPADTSSVAASPKMNWKLNRDTPYVPSPVIIDGRLFFTKSNAALLSCVDVATGKPIYGPTRIPGVKAFYTSPVATNKAIYFASREGNTVVISNSDQFEVLATNKLDGDIDASLAIVGKQIFIRSKTHLYCVAEE